MIKELAYAKLNLTLEVLDSDINNYHLVNTIMVPINLYDEIYLEKNNNIVIVDDDIENNIMKTASTLFFKHFNIKGGVKIKYKKNIPLAAGLAGGSSDAAAVLRGLKKLYSPAIKDEELKELCKELGSDVAFFIDSKLAKCTHYGEVINKLDINYKKIKVLLIKPSSGLSTKEVYKNYQYEKCDRSLNEINIINGLKNNDIDLINKNIFNDLNKTSLLLSSDLRYLYVKLQNITKTHISGSGPTMFILNPTNDVINEVKKMIDEDTFYAICDII